MKRTIVMLVMVFLSTGCATKYNISPKKTNNQHSIYKEGQPTLISNKKHLVSVRGLMNNYTSNKRAKFVISVKNKGSNKFNFSTDNITIKTDDKNLKVHSYKELVAEAKQRRQSLALAAALGGIGRTMQANQAGYKYHSGNVNTNFYNSNGYRGRASSTYSGYTYDSYENFQAQMQANQQTINDINRIKRSTERQLNKLSNTILKKETIFPSQTHGGYIVVEPLPVPKDKTILSVDVNIDNEVHHLKFTYSPKDK